MKADVKMDDFLSGAIIDGVLGINLTVNDDFMSQWDDVYHGTDEQLKKKVLICILPHADHNNNATACQ